MKPHERYNVVMKAYELRMLSTAILQEGLETREQILGFIYNRIEELDGELKDEQRNSNDNN